LTKQCWLQEVSSLDPLVRLPTILENLALKPDHYFTD